MKKGIFIVIDGQDGTGKATQTKLLLKKMVKEDYPVQTISFPQYNHKSAGPLEEYLSGKYGSAQEVGPKIASVLFAVDRFDASKQINDWLNSGINVIADRYVGSNMGHQGSKIVSDTERQKYFDWNMKFEHDLMKIPKPDINIILHIPVDISIKLAHERELDGKSKHNLKTDIHETDYEHLRLTEKTYLQLTELYDNFFKIECINNEVLLTPQIIHNKIWTTINNQLTLIK